MNVGTTAQLGRPVKGGEEAEEKEKEKDIIIFASSINHK